MLIKASLDTASHIACGTWEPGCYSIFLKGKELLDNNIDILQSKKVIFLPGGIGRIANYANTIGIDAYNLDISYLYEKLSKSVYPNIKYIKANMSVPLASYDYAVFEQTFGGGFKSNLLKDINNWQTVTKILPNTYSIFIYRCNSTILDNIVYAPEQEGQAYYKKAMSNGSIAFFGNYSELEDLEIEEIVIDTNRPIPNLDIKTDPSKKYTLIGRPFNKSRVISQDTFLKAKIYNKGYKQSFQNNITIRDYRLPEE